MWSHMACFAVTAMPALADDAGGFVDASSRGMRVKIGFSRANSLLSRCLAQNNTNT